MEGREMMVKSILLDQNAKEWITEVDEFVGLISCIIDQKTQNIKIYYVAKEGYAKRQIHVIDCGTNQKSELNDSFSFLATLPQHDGNIVHHLFAAYE